MPPKYMIPSRWYRSPSIGLRKHLNHTALQMFIEVNDASHEAEEVAKCHERWRLLQAAAEPLLPPSLGVFAIQCVCSRALL